jgi:uncharacterized protein related to proFAR isomerase
MAGITLNVEVTTEQISEVLAQFKKNQDATMELGNKILDKLVDFGNKITDFEFEERKQNRSIAASKAAAESKSPQAIALDLKSKELEYRVKEADSEDHIRRIAEKGKNVKESD